MTSMLSARRRPRERRAAPRPVRRPLRRSRSQSGRSRRPRRCRRLTGRREPSPDRLVDLGRAQEIEVIRAAHDPAPRRGDRERALGVFMVAERAGDRDEPISDRSVVDAARCLRRGCGDRIACDTRGQRNDHAGVVSAGEAVAALPILGNQRAVAKVGDARAAQAAQAIERGRVGNRSASSTHAPMRSSAAP